MHEVVCFQIIRNHYFKKNVNCQINVKISDSLRKVTRNQNNDFINVYKMDCICKELNINIKNVFSTSTSNLFTVVVHSSWLKKWLKNTEINSTVNNADYTLQLGESVSYPWRKIFIRVRTHSIYSNKCIYSHVCHWF